MIQKLQKTKNGWKLSKSTTIKDLVSILTLYSDVNCILCNDYTKTKYGLSLLRDYKLVCCKNLPDDVIYINNFL